MLIILNVAHTEDTPGKCSPDGKFKETRYSRVICERVASKLRLYGYNVEVVQQDTYYGQNQGLMQLTNLVNKMCNKVNNDAIFVSIHVNASAAKSWDTASYWCAFTTKGVTEADYLSKDLYWAAEHYLRPLGKRISIGTKDTVGYDWEANFWVLKKTTCPAVLTENFMQNNKSDVEFLTSEKGKEIITNIHIDGILAYLKNRRYK